MTVIFCGRTAASVGIGSSPSNRKERGSCRCIGRMFCKKQDAARIAARESIVMTKHAFEKKEAVQ